MGLGVGLAAEIKFKTLIKAFKKSIFLSYCYLPLFYLKYSQK